jgi:hypothetical protein
MIKKYTYYNNCVNWPKHDVTTPGGLSDMIYHAIEISRQSFKKHVSKGQLDGLANFLGYAKHPKQGLTMAGDPHITYHRSKLHGQRVYYLRHSAIEYVFTRLV